MASNSLIKAYHFLPYPLKVVTTSIPALYKKFKKYGRFFNQCYDFLLTNSIEYQEQIADQELEIYLNYIKNKCPFFASNYNTACNIEDFPIVDKTFINKHYSDFLLEKPYFIGKSSGTTGQPIYVPYSKNVYQKEYAFWWYHRSFGAVHRGDRVATFGGHKTTAIENERPPFWLFNFAENQVFFSSYHLSIKNLPHYMKALNNFRPNFIHGYPSSIYYVSKYIIEKNVQLSFKPKMIVTSSETTHDLQRQTIEKAFGCKVYIWYGNTEFCGHITECSHGNLHVQPYHSLIRVLRENNTEAKPGETGRIVATNFSNYAFALVNYDMKDIVKVSKTQNCPCDKGGLVLDYIHGRIEDYVLTPEGRFVGRLDHLFKDAENVRNGQIVQNDPSSIVIRIEREYDYSVNTEKAILIEAKARLGNTIDIQFEYVDYIEKEPNGKYKFVLQKIDLENRINSL